MLSRKGASSLHLLLGSLQSVDAIFVAVFFVALVFIYVYVQHIFFLPFVVLIEHLYDCFCSFLSISVILLILLFLIFALEIAVHIYAYFKSTYK